MSRADIDTGSTPCPRWLRSVASGLDRALPNALEPGELGTALGTWEWRISLDGDDERVVAQAEDGGARLERLDPATGRSGDALFLVGAEPADLLVLAGLDDSRTFPEEIECSRELVRRLAHQLADSTRRALRTMRGIPGAGLPGTPRFRLWLRARVLAREGQPPFAGVESGLRVRLEAEGAPSTDGWIGAPAALPPPVELREHLAAGFEAVDRRPPGRPLAPGHRGRVVLAPEAAGWWVHEMGHAALEAPGPIGAAGPPGCRIVDAPARAPWPAGFAVDDLGARGAPGVLWDATGCHPPSPDGRRRRPSVRHAATPSLSATGLDVDPERVSRSSFDPEDLPRVERIAAARFDPATRCIFLRISRAGGRDVDGVAVVRADEGWQGLEVAGPGGPRGQDIAACSRQGGLNAVMVGAPTLSLEVEHVTWASPAPNAGNGAKIVVTTPCRQKGGQGIGSAMGPSRRGVQPRSDVHSKGTKSSRMEEVSAHPGRTAVTRGFEQGGWAPLPRPAPDRPPRQAIVGGGSAGTRADAEALREQIVEAAPGAWAGRIAVTLARAQVEETEGDLRSAARAERAVVSGTVTALGPAGLGLWSRVGLLEGVGWSPGWVEAIVRQLDDDPDSFPGHGGPERAHLRRLHTVVDVFALADLLRVAAWEWLADDRRRGEPVACGEVSIEDVEPSSDGEGSANRQVVAAGRLTWGAREARQQRSSWRDLPAPGWSHLTLGFPETAARSWPEAVNLVRRIDRVGRVLFASGTACLPGEAPSAWGPVPVPEPAWWLLRLKAPCGPRVPDGTGPPVSVPACLLGESPL